MCFRARVMLQMTHIQIDKNVQSVMGSWGGVVGCGDRLKFGNEGGSCTVVGGGWWL